MRNIYKDLGVSRNCSIGEARKSFEDIKAKYTKDSDEYRLALRAYNIIRDDNRREEYDSKLRQVTNNNSNRGKYENDNVPTSKKNMGRGKFEGNPSKFISSSIDKKCSSSKPINVVTKSIPKKDFIARKIAALGLASIMFGAGYLTNELTDDNTNINTDITIDDSSNISEEYKEDFYRFIRIYRVGNEDSIESITQQANCSYSDLCEINGASEGNLELKPGYITLIPYYVSPDDLNKVVNVESIDEPISVSSFAAKHDTLPYTMEMLNPKLISTNDSNGENMISGSCVIPDWTAMSKKNLDNLNSGISEVRDKGDIHSISR